LLFPGWRAQFGTLQHGLDALETEGEVGEGMALLRPRRAVPEG
jgi:hypothetical protein